MPQSNLQIKIFLILAKVLLVVVIMTFIQGDRPLVHNVTEWRSP
ncbi:hypothetical protein [Sphaerospermopsis aphanizomenoides]|nr:hypothetical protein [Sphaerospermopsis aphanizomenoides]